MKIQGCVSGERLQNSIPGWKEGSCGYFSHGDFYEMWLDDDGPFWTETEEFHSSKEKFIKYNWNCPVGLGVDEDGHVFITCGEKKRTTKLKLRAEEVYPAIGFEYQSGPSSKQPPSAISSSTRFFFSATDRPTSSIPDGQYNPSLPKSRIPVFAEASPWDRSLTYPLGQVSLSGTLFFLPRNPTPSNLGF
jgi:hypothetical protein